MRRLPTSKDVVSSLTISSIRLPATVSPCSSMYRRAPATTCLPAAARVPVIGMTMPTLTVSCAAAPPATEAAIARVATNRAMHLLHIAVLRW